MYQQKVPDRNIGVELSHPDTAWKRWKTLRCSERRFCQKVGSRLLTSWPCAQRRCSGSSNISHTSLLRNNTYAGRHVCVYLLDCWHRPDRIRWWKWFKIWTLVSKTTERERYSHTAGRMHFLLMYDKIELLTCILLYLVILDQCWTMKCSYTFHSSSFALGEEFWIFSHG